MATEIPTTSTRSTGKIGEMRANVVAMLRLALPIVMARAGWMFMSFVDILMVGRFNTVELAYMSLATILVSVAYVTMMGMLLGTLVTTSNLFGQRRYSEIGAVWRRSLPYAFTLGLLVLLMTLFAEPILLIAGQEPSVAYNTGQVIRIYGYGMPLGGLVYVTCQYFLEGIKRPIPAMLLMLVANVINVALNWVLIFGHLGFDPLGAAGSAWGTTIIRTFLTAGLVIYILTMPGARIFGVRKAYTGGFRAWAEQRRIGYAAGLSFGIEHMAFVMLFVFAGLLGTLELAAVTIVFNAFGLCFMVANGIANAAAVHVGIAYGQQNSRRIASAGWTGCNLQLAVLLVPAILMICMPQWFARIYSTDAALINLATPIYVLGGFALLLDTTQTLWSNVLRARHDKWFATASHFVCYLLLMVPLAWYFAFTLGHRGEGLFEALIIASVLSVILLTWRFVALCKRDRLGTTALAI
ncbi:MAG: MATE family multidrug resistance protein [Gammaproteobacteria bacterium]|jgi:MATE family multidrug resistance protein